MLGRPVRDLRLLGAHRPRRSPPRDDPLDPRWRRRSGPLPARRGPRVPWGL